MTHRLNKKSDISPIRNKTPIVYKNNQRRDKSPCITNYNNYTTLSDVSTITNRNNTNTKCYNVLTTNNYQITKKPNLKTIQTKQVKDIKDSFSKKQQEIQIGLKKLSRASILNNINNLQKITQQQSQRHCRSGSSLYKHN